MENKGKKSTFERLVDLFLCFKNGKIIFTQNKVNAGGRNQKKFDVSFLCIARHLYV